MKWVLSFDFPNDAERDISAELSAPEILDAALEEGRVELLCDEAALEDLQRRFSGYAPKVEPARMSDQGETWLRGRVVPAVAGVSLPIDAGDSFGSGAHPTTLLCLERLEDLAPLEGNFLDVGTGSGILALAALKLGAGEATGTDTDPRALQQAAKNAAKLGLKLDLQRELPPRARYRTIAANIVPAVLIELAPQITRALDSRGELMLSGIRGGQEHEIVRTYKNSGLNFVGSERKGDWIRLDFAAAW